MVNEREYKPLELCRSIIFEDLSKSPEICAIAFIQQILNELDKKAVLRVLDYLKKGYEDAIG